MYTNHTLPPIQRILPRTRLIRLVTIALITTALLTTTFGSDRPTHAQSLRSPQVMLLAYYSAIGLHNYPQAYSFWVANGSTPVQSYADFASGYLTTDRVDPYPGALQNPPAGLATSELGRIPALLIGYHTDGTVATYSGCFVIGSTANSAFGIAGSTFATIGQALPDSTTISQALKTDCYAAATSATPTITVTGMIDPGQQTLAAYYKQINQRAYADAYALWLHPTPGPKPNGAPAIDYRPAYADFVAGYSDTVYVFGYYGQYTETGASAGHAYLDGYLPVVLIGYHTDGSVTAASGCYVLGTLPKGGVGAKSLGIVAGSLKAIPLDSTIAGVPDGRTISADLAFDCTTLNGQY